MGRTETDRKITGEPWSSIPRPKSTKKKDTLRSERRSALTKDLTEPTFLEMSGNPTYRELGNCFGIDYLIFLAWISCPSQR